MQSHQRGGARDDAIGGQAKDASGRSALELAKGVGQASKGLHYYRNRM
jgi:hypothetical protein